MVQIDVLYLLGGEVADVQGALLNTNQKIFLRAYLEVERNISLPAQNEVFTCFRKIFHSNSLFTRRE